MYCPPLHFSLCEMVSGEKGSFSIDFVNGDYRLQRLSAVIAPKQTEVVIQYKDAEIFIIRRGDTEIIIQDGKLLNRDVLSSGTAEGIDVAMFLAAMIARESTFYYCDEHFSYIQSDIEKRIFGIMLERIGANEQLIFTTHNTDIIRNAVENDVFASLPQDALLDEFEMGWANEQ